MRVFPAIVISLNMVTLVAQSQTSMEQDAIRITPQCKCRRDHEKSVDRFRAVRLHPSYFSNCPGSRTTRRGAENSHESLAWDRARVRAMEAAGNHGWLRGQPANHEREHAHPDGLPPGLVHGDGHGGHHCSGRRL